MISRHIPLSPMIGSLVIFQYNENGSEWLGRVGAVFPNEIGTGQAVLVFSRATDGFPRRSSLVKLSAISEVRRRSKPFFKEGDRVRIVSDGMDGAQYRVAGLVDKDYRIIPSVEIDVMPRGIFSGDFLLGIDFYYLVEAKDGTWKRVAEQEISLVSDKGEV